jgi:hypothetical protein
MVSTVDTGYLKNILTNFEDGFLTSTKEKKILY